MRGLGVTVVNFSLPLTADDTDAVGSLILVHLPVRCELHRHRHLLRTVRGRQHERELEKTDASDAEDGVRQFRVLADPGLVK